MTRRSSGSSVTPVYNTFDANMTSGNEVNREIELQFRCLEVVLAENPKTKEGVMIKNSGLVVNLEKFGKVLAWFGPISVPENRKILLLEKITSLLKQSWFHGDVPTKVAESKLTAAREGTFLIRFSSTNLGWYTISKKSDKSITHQRIIHQPGGAAYYLNNKKYDSLHHLVEAAAGELQLVEACNGSPYVHLFQNQHLSGYIQTGMLGI